MNKIFIFLLVLSISLTACNKEAAIEDNSIGGDGLNLVELDSFKLTTKTIYDNAIKGKNIPSILLGQTNDSRIGESNAAFYSQMSLTKNSYDLGTNPVLDSIVLILDQKKSYGQLNSSYDISVYELSSELLDDYSYSNNTVLNLEANPLASVTNFNFKEGVQSIRIPLTNTFGNQLLNQFGTSVMASTDNFKEYFKGFYVSATALSGDAMVSIDINTDKSRMQLYFHSDSQSDTSYIFSIGAKDVSVNQYLSNNTGSQASLAANTQDNEIAFVSSMSQFKTSLTFPDLTSLENVIINKASLTIYQADYGETESTDFPEQENLFLFQNLQDTTIDFLPDFSLTNSSVFGGKKILEEINGQNTNAYTFYITKYIQSLVNGTAKTHDLYITDITNNEGNRIKIGGGNHSTLPIKLNIIYTEIK